ncbi:MAG: hypothetical protein KC944_19100, partial [Candidatus Omnitrophica bacterium]|nr:hypothetical protein [Candidatus Omnitrophota bacterium]
GLDDWVDEGPRFVDIPFTYQSAEPDGVTAAPEGHRLKWDLLMFRSARQAVTLKQAVIFAGPILNPDLDLNGTVNADDLIHYVRTHRKVSGINPNFEWLLNLALEWDPGTAKALPSELGKEVAK